IEAAMNHFNAVDRLTHALAQNVVGEFVPALVVTTIKEKQRPLWNFQGLLCDECFKMLGQFCFAAGFQRRERVAWTRGLSGLSGVATVAVVAKAVAEHFTAIGAAPAHQACARRIHASP